MGRRVRIFAQSGGFSLVELLFVLATIGLCLAIGMSGIAQGLRCREAKSAAQSWQAAAGWAQAGVLWHGGSVRFAYQSGVLSLAHTEGTCGGQVGTSVSRVATDTNVSRWRLSDGLAVTFGGRIASPDGGGSLYFGETKSFGYRVVVRPESGLTARTLLDGVR
jgi:Tfp pilus assembly protein FimT